MVRYLQTDNHIYATVVGDSARWGEEWLNHFASFTMYDDVCTNTSPTPAARWCTPEGASNGMKKSYAKIADEAAAVHAGLPEPRIHLQHQSRSINVIVNRPDVVQARLLSSAQDYK